MLDVEKNTEIVLTEILTMVPNCSNQRFVFCTS